MRRIRDQIVHTPTLHSRTLSEMTGANVYLKFENLQFTAAYKERGALNTLLQLDDAARAKGVIAASAGNHAQGLAYHAKRLGIPATIVMPINTPTVKVTQTEGHGATVVLEGDTFDAAYAHARELEAERGYTFVHPFDDVRIVAGAGTTALEMLADVPEIDTLRGADRRRRADQRHGHRRPRAQDQADARGRRRGRALSVDVQPHQRHRHALRGRHAGRGHRGQGAGPDHLARWSRDLVDDIVLVSERRLEESVSLLLQIEKTVVEGAGAAGLAALLEYPERFAGRTVGVVLCGGNIDTRLLANVLLRDLARSGRLARLRIRLAGPARRAVQRRPHLPRRTRQHHRGLSPARVHDPAGQGPDHRHRVRNPRPCASRPADGRACRPAGTRCSRWSWRTRPPVHETFAPATEIASARRDRLRQPLARLERESAQTNQPRDDDGVDSPPTPLANRAARH